MKKYKIQTPLFLTFMLLTACGTSLPDDQASFVEDYCAVYVPWCEAVKTWGDGGACKKNMERYIEAGAFSSTYGKACIERLRSPHTNLMESHHVPECIAAFPPPSGTVEPGGACTTSAECKSGPMDPGFCLGKRCRIVASVGREGAVCVGDLIGESFSSIGFPSDEINVARCPREDGLYCDRASLTCKKHVALGERCASHYACIKGGYCNADDTCAPVLAIGSPCKEDRECGTDAFCTNGECTPVAYDGTAMVACHN